MDRAWQAFLRRFDIEHTFRFLKQVLGWTCPKLRDPAAADRWTWIVIACAHGPGSWLARGLAEDLRLPWQRPCPARGLTPARVRRGFRNIRQALPDLASAPKPGKPGPGRPSARIEEPPSGHPPRRGQDRQASRAKEENAQAEGLNNKPRGRCPAGMWLIQERPPGAVVRAWCPKRSEEDVLWARVAATCEPTGPRWMQVQRPCGERGLPLVCIQPLVSHIAGAAGLRDA